MIPAQEVTLAQEVTSASPLDSPEVEAFIVARTLEGEIEDGALAHLFEMGSQLKHVLCPYPSQAAVQAADMLYGVDIFGKRVHFKIDMNRVKADVTWDPKGVKFKANLTF